MPKINPNRYYIVNMIDPRDPVLIYKEYKSEDQAFEVVLVLLKADFRTYPVIKGSEAIRHNIPIMFEDNYGINREKSIKGVDLVQKLIGYHYDGFLGFITKNEKHAAYLKHRYHTEPERRRKLLKNKQDRRNAKKPGTREERLRKRHENILNNRKYLKQYRNENNKV